MEIHCLAQGCMKNVTVSVAFSISPLFQSAHTKLVLVHVYRIITVVMYLPVSGVQELFLEPPLKDCHLMDSFNRMVFMHLQ